MTGDDPLALSGLVFDDTEVSDLENFDLTDNEKDAVSDLSAQENEYISLESRIENCAFLLDTIIKTKGMCRSFAEEAHALIPEFNGVPLNYYSQQPTKTQYSAAVEDISTSVVALIAASIAAVIAIIYKLYKWLSGGKEKADSEDVEANAAKNKEAVDTVKDNLKDINDEVTTLEKMVRDMNATIKDADGKEYRCHSLDEFVEKNFTDRRLELVRRYQSLEDPFFYDIIRKGHFTRLMDETVLVTKQLLFILEAKLKLVKEIHTRDKSDFSPESARINAVILGKIKQDNTIKFNGKECTFKDITLELAKAKHDVESQTHSDRIKFDNLVSLIYERYNSKQFHDIIDTIVSSTDVLDRFREQIEKLEKSVGSFTGDGMPGKSTESLGEDIRAVIRAITDEVSAYSQILIQISLYKDKTTTLFNHCVVMCDEVIAKFHKAAEAANVKIPNEWKAAALRVHSARKAITEAAGIRFVGGKRVN